jgi:hypothetical protein
MKAGHAERHTGCARGPLSKAQHAAADKHIVPWQVARQRASDCNGNQEQHPLWQKRVPKGFAGL